MGKKKILILVMTCNLPQYRRKERSIRETWAKPVLEGKYPNVDLWFFTSAAKDACVDTEKHRIFIDADDRRDRTFQKLCKTLLYIDSHKDIFGEYDYIVRVNISSVLNTERLLQLVDSLNGNEPLVWSSTSFTQPWVARHAPFFSGECFMLPRFAVNIVKAAYARLRTELDKLEADKTPGTSYVTDDGWLTTVFESFWKKAYPTHLRTWGIVYEPFPTLRQTERYADHIVITHKTDYLTDDPGTSKNTADLDRHPKYEDVDEKKREDIWRVLESADLSDSEEWLKRFNSAILDKECRNTMVRAAENGYCDKEKLVKDWFAYLEQREREKAAEQENKDTKD